MAVLMLTLKEELSVVEHSYSCALERSFLYHGRMYLSAWHICFHSNIFSKQMKVIIPLGDIDEGKEQSELLDFIKEEEQLESPDIVKEKEQPALLDYLKEDQSERGAHSCSSRGSDSQSSISEKSVAKPENFQPFIKEEVLTRIYNDFFPCTAEQFFKFLLDDGSTFTSEYHTNRKDFNLIIECFNKISIIPVYLGQRWIQWNHSFAVLKLVGQWCASDEYNGQVREVSYRSLCHFPMCPPDIPVTEWQHVVLSADKKTLVFETIQQTQGVPFASYFENDRTCS
ncbi:UNVERIFIED_CONTAM: BAG-associated GRAM protein 1 [Sesamum calycinum]|uniref:BAG-associated GRAM protein 1 n=1 Tax=Sesamum calycinum TaxID=2727403 RepID=A0AAW2QLH4_9LAMI